MSLITKMRKEKAVWWERAGENQYGASYFQLPVEIDCRWEQGSREVLTPEGVSLASQITVYVDREMKNGDMLMYGTMPSDVSHDPIADQVKGAHAIVRFDKTPNLKASEYLLVAYL